MDKWSGIPFGIFEGGECSGESPVISMCTGKLGPPSRGCRGISSDLRVALDVLFLFSHFSFG